MTKDFENLIINLDDLPEHKLEEFTPIEKAYLKVSLISSGIFFFIMMITGPIILLFNAEYKNDWRLYLLTAGSVLVVWLLVLTLSIKSFKRKKYSLRQKDIVYTKGLIWSKRTTIPFNRIQHAEVKQGPFERVFKLHNLKIFTAGGSSSDLSIPGLKENTALKLKDFIMKNVEEDGVGEG